jgi:AcrR family transcriptional regulator
MPRPRVHDTERVLDAAESLVAASGPAAATTRALSAAVGVSNGALYHSFGSRSELLARAWLRAGRRLLAAQDELVDAAPSAVEAVLAAAEAPAVFADRYPDSATLLLTARRDEVLGTDLPDGIAADIADLESTLIGLMIRLALRMWDRKDAAAVDTITLCIVDLPTAILLSRDRLHRPIARQQLRAAVRAVLDVGPPRKETHDHQPAV